MEFILEFFSSLIYFLCVISIGEFFLGYKRKNSKYEKWLLFIIVCMSIITILSPNVLLKAITHITSVFLVSKIWFKEDWINILGLYFGSSAVLTMLSMLVDVVCAEFISLFAITHADKVVEVINLLFILLIIRILGKYYDRKYRSGVKSISIKYWILFIIIMFFDSSVIIILGEFILDTLQVGRRSIAVFSYWCVVVGTLVQLILLINTLVTRNIHKENEELAKQFLESQKEHYQYLEKREYETKKFRHDIKNHLLLVENLITTQKYDEAEEYLKTLNLKILPIGSKISVNNGIADAILNRFYMEAEEKGVKLIVKGHFPMTCYITAYDLCTILSNLLSNAIQAEHEAGGKEVLVNIKYTDSNVMLVIENDYIHELNESDGVFKSTKTDDLKHGYGLHNVNECVEKNGGFISISTENCRFKVKVLLVNENGEGQ